MISSISKCSPAALLTAAATALMASALFVAPAHAVLGGSAVEKPVSWAASFQNESGEHVCGGTLIDQRWVLTAHHCTAVTPQPETYNVRVGSLDNQSGGELVGVKRIVEHPDAHCDPENNCSGPDYSLLELDHPVNAAPLPLAQQTPPTGDPLRILGWGHTCDGPSCQPRKLQEVTIPITAPEDCAKGPVVPHASASSICTITDGAKGAMPGDSGGPAVVDTPDGERLAGVISAGATNPETGQRISVFGNVSTQLAWINATIQGG